MSSTGEAFALENAVDQLRAEGFEVFVRPTGLALPAFLKGYSPDAIAVRGGEKLVVGIVKSGVPIRNGFEQLQDVVSKNPDWKFRAIWISSTPDESLGQVSRSEIEKSIGSVKALIGSGNLQPALLMAWATFEALGRAISPDKFKRPQTPGRLIEVLAGSGALTPTEADRLRGLAKTRNLLIHGDLQQSVSDEEISKFVLILEQLSRLVLA
jgi:uncharacterized protein YutE (UPF0331/DUF86 family)